MESLIYWFKPYIFFICGFVVGHHLDHPTKWISVLCFILASIAIEYMRYMYREFDYERIEIKDVK